MLAEAPTQLTSGAAHLHRRWIRRCLIITAILLATLSFHAAFNSSGRLLIADAALKAVFVAGVSFAAAVLGATIAGLSSRVFYALYAWLVGIITLLYIALGIAADRPLRLPDLSPPGKSTKRPGTVLPPSPAANPPHAEEIKRVS